MQRKELRKRIKDFTHATNFYKLGLVRRYILAMEKDEQALEKAIPTVTSPHCGSKSISVECAESDYDDSRWLFCNKCEHDFDDTFGYIDATNELEAFAWCNIIAVELAFEEPDIHSQAWKDTCELEIKKYLGIIKQEPFNFF